MTSYETGMIVLGILTFTVTLIGLIVKLLLVIIDKDNKAKKLLPHVSGQLVR